MDYDAYMPHINVKDGVARVLNNKKLYFNLLIKFKGRTMANNVISAINAGDSNEVVQTAHALKGTAANLGFPTVYKITEEIESNAKKGNPCPDLVPQLEAAIDDLEHAVAKLTTE